MRGRGGRDQAARGSTPTHRHLLTRVIITDYWTATNHTKVLLQMKCIILLLLEKRRRQSHRFFLGPAGSCLGFAQPVSCTLWGMAALDSLRSFLFLSFFYSPRSSLWSPLSFPLVTNVYPFSHQGHYGFSLCQCILSLLWKKDLCCPRECLDLKRHYFVNLRRTSYLIGIFVLPKRISRPKT